MVGSFGHYGFFGAPVPVAVPDYPTSSPQGSSSGYSAQTGGINIAGLPTSRSVGGSGSVPTGGYVANGTAAADPVVDAGASATTGATEGTAAPPSEAWDPQMHWTEQNHVIVMPDPLSLDEISARQRSAAEVAAMNKLRAQRAARAARLANAGPSNGQYALGGLLMLLLAGGAFVAGRKL